MPDGNVLNPLVRWGQTQSHIYLTILVIPAEQDDQSLPALPEINIGEEKLKVKIFGDGGSGRNTYGFEIDFYLPVIKEQSSWSAVGRGIEIVLKKEFKDPWPRLSSQKLRLPWVKFDFDRFQFNESDASADENGGNSQPPHLAGVEVEHRQRPKSNKAEESDEDYDAFLAIIKSPLTLYLLFYNLVQFSGFLYIFGACVYLAVKHGFNEAPDYVYNQVIDQLTFVQGLAIMEIIHVCLGWVKGGGLSATLMQVFGRNLVLFIMVVPHEELHETTTFYWLVVAWSSIEIIRYPFYILSLIGEEWGLLTYLRYTLWIPMYPIGFMNEGKLILKAMPIVEERNSYSLSLPNNYNFSFHFPTFIKIYLLFMFYGFYILMMHMYKRRKTKIGPNPKGKPLSFLEYLTQRSSHRVLPATSGNQVKKLKSK